MPACDTKGQGLVPRAADDRVRAMEQTVEELRAIIRAYDERWALYEYNLHRSATTPTNCGDLSTQWPEERSGHGVAGRSDDGG